MDTLDSEGTSDVHSTKQPSQEKEGKQSKRQKREEEEELLLKRAIACMDSATNKATARNDADDIFGEYVAAC